MYVCIYHQVCKGKELKERKGKRKKIMDQEQLDSLAVTHLLQHTLRSLCIHDNSQWVYAVFWRILPRNYPPPKWDSQGGVYDRSRGNRRNWILVWEDGFCNFAAATTNEINASSEYHNSSSSSSAYGNCEYQQHYRGLQPELFFKMSHEIYNYGEGLIGKVAADHSHKWIHKEPNDQEINFLSAWHNTADSQPRTWEAQFQCGIKTIALIAVREGVIQLGAVHKVPTTLPPSHELQHVTSTLVLIFFNCTFKYELKVIEDLSYVVLLRKKFSYIESIPGVLLPHPSSSVFPFKIDHASSYIQNGAHQEPWTHSYHHHHHQNSNLLPQNEYYDHFAQQPMKITPSMSSLEALLSKLPNVVPVSSSSSPNHFEAQNHYLLNTNRPMELEKVAKEEYEDEDRNNENDGGGETSGSMPSYHQFIYHDELNISSSNMNNS